MDIQKIMTLISSGVIAWGAFNIVWGAITLGNGIKDHTGSEISRGFAWIVGGVVMIAAAAYLLTIDLGL